MKFKFFIEKKRVFLCVLFAVSMGIIYHFSAAVLSDADTVYGVFEAIVGYSDFFDFSFYNLNGVLLIFILAFPLINYFVKDASQVKVYLFTRMKSKGRFIACKQLSILLYCFIISGVYFFVKLLLFHEALNILHILYCFLIFFLFLAVFCSAVCTLSLILGSIKSFVLCVFAVSAMCLSVTIYYLKYNSVTEIFLVLLNPAARFMLGWGSEFSEMLSEFHLKQLHIGSSTVFFSVLYGLSVLLSAIIIKKRSALTAFDEE